MDTHNQDHDHDQETKEELELIVKNWKKIPVIGTSILMDTLPYLMSPWEHWNKIIDTLKDAKKEEDGDVGDTAEATVAKSSRGAPSVPATVPAQTTQQRNRDIENPIEPRDTGYITEISDNEFTSGEVSDVDWSLSDDDF